jgi:transposase, IS30 family
MSKPRLTTSQKQTALSLKARGFSTKEVGRQLSMDCSMVDVMFNAGRFTNGVADAWSPRADHLTMGDREEIRVGLSHGESMSSIARRIGRSPSTVTREVGSNGGRDHYRIWSAHCRAREGARRPKDFKLRRGALERYVSSHLGALWSPQEICRRLPLDYPDDPEMRVSPETIYQSLFVQGRGELRRELARCLRTGRTRRKSQGRQHRRGKIPDMVLISERPPEVADRAVPGHWEGDLIVGLGHRSAVGTLVERTSRFVLLLHLPDDHTASTVEMAMRKAIMKLPSELRRSVTWDQGSEMTNHVNITLATGMPIYFCDPRSPWQRGSNENTNGLLRQYLPKETDLSVHTAADLRRIQRSLNTRPRATLGYMTPLEKLNEIVALTD